MLNQKQKALLSVAAAKTLEEGSGITINDRQLAQGEFAPIESKDQSGGIVFSQSLVPDDICKSAGVCFMPVVDSFGKESLGLFIFSPANHKLINIGNFDPDLAGSLVGDLMVSTLSFSSEVAANVNTAVTKAVIECDYKLKDHLLENSKNALNKSFETVIKKRLDAQQKAFDATVKDIQDRAETKAAKLFTKQFLKVAEVCAETRTSVRDELYKETVLPIVKNLVKVSKRYED